MTTDTTTALAEAEELTPEQIEQAERIAALLASRAVAEAAAAKDIARHAKALSTTRDTATEAVASAQQALLTMVEAIDRHNRAIQAATSDLLDRGLSLVDEAGSHDTGASVRNEVRLSGRWWLQVNPTAMFERTTNTARRAALSWITQRVTSSTVQPEFLERIPEMPVKPAERLIARMAEVPRNVPKVHDPEGERQLRAIKWTSIR